MLKMKEANSEYENNGTGDTYYLSSEEGLFEI
jgi:YHS domain-containing protein